MRYKRLKDQQIHIPPLKNDQKFRLSHDAKRVYYLGEEKGKRKLVIVWLSSLSYKFVDLGEQADKIESFQDSSLFDRYLCYVIKREKKEKINNVEYYKLVKDYFVIDLETPKKKIIWELPECEAVFFKGVNASGIEMIEYKELKLENRTHEGKDHEKYGDTINYSLDDEEVDRDHLDYED